MHSLTQMLVLKLILQHSLLHLPTKVVKHPAANQGQANPAGGAVQPAAGTTQPAGQGNQADPNNAAAQAQPGIKQHLQIKQVKEITKQHLIIMQHRQIKHSQRMLQQETSSSQQQTDKLKIQMLAILVKAVLILH